MGLRITNTRVVTESASEKKLKLVDAVPFTKLAAARKRVALHLSTRTMQPPLWTGKDGKTWDRLISQRTEPVVLEIIDQCITNRHRVMTGAYADAHITPSTIEFYAKTFFTHYVQPFKEDEDIDELLRQNCNDTHVLRNLVVMHRLPRERVQAAIGESATDRVFDSSVHQSTFDDF